MASSRPAGSAIFMCLAVVGLGLAAVWFGGPPAPAPAAAPPTAFSAERAMAHVEQIAQRPHPTGSADHARVRDYVVAAFERLGLKPQRQAATVAQTRGRLVIGRVENVLVRIPGTASTGAVLFASHYDSVPAAPGAADAGSGVAALLEGVRAIRAGEALRNDLIVLVTDGEELGLLGAVAFVEQHRWAKDVRAVVNFEARGTSGPVQMFETGPDNGGVVEAWAESVPHPTGTSLAYEIYKLMPNDTDFSVFKRLDVAGLNFAFIGTREDHHTPHDNPATLDRGSLQHHGATAVALARRFGSADLKTLQTRDAVYFSLPIVYLVARYPVMWALPLALAAVVLFVWAVVRARRRTLASIGGMLLACLIVAAFGAAAGYWGWRFSRLMIGLHSGWLSPGNIADSAPYAALMVAVVVTAWCGLYVLLRKWFAPHSLLLGSALIWIVAAVAAAWFVPGGSYVVLWPVAGALLAGFALPGAAGRGVAGRGTAGRGAAGRGAAVGGGRALIVALCGVPASIILWPLVATFFTAMGLAPEFGVALTVLTVFALVSLTAQLEVIAEGRRWWPAGLALLASCVCLGTGMAVTPYSATHPQTVNIEYVLNADVGKAQWAARMDPPDAWASQYLSSNPSSGRPPALVPPWSRVQGVPGYLRAEAPLVELAAPSATLVSSAAVSEGQGRTLTIHVKPAAEGHVLTVWTNGARVLDAAIGGTPVRLSTAPRAADDTAWSVDFVNAAADGATITLTVKSLGRLTVALLDRSAGLPVIPGLTFEPRPSSIVPIQSGDMTIVRRTYTF